MPSLGVIIPPQFKEKSKLNPLYLLENNEFYVAAMQTLLTNEAHKAPVSDNNSQDVCRLYGLHGMDDINEARFQLFFMTGGTKTCNQVKNLNCSSLPPSWSFFLEKHILRSNNISDLFFLTFIFCTVDAGTDLMVHYQAQL